MTEPFMTDPPNMDRSLVEVAKTAPRADTSSATDAELITAARSGDAAAFGTLYERHAAAARRLARHLVKHQADVDDVVAETFARVLSALRRGNGPVVAFRPYLLTAVRRVAIDVLRGQRHQVPTDDTELPDPGEPFDDPAVADLDRSLITKAFLSLPERWSAVLWHTEVEQAKPAEVASLLGVSANSVAALRYRAREGLRQAYLQLHLSGRAEGNCAAIRRPAWCLRRGPAVDQELQGSRRAPVRLRLVRGRLCRSHRDQRLVARGAGTGRARRRRRRLPGTGQPPGRIRRGGGWQCRDDCP